MMIPVITQARKFSKNRIDIPILVLSPANAPGGSAQTVTMQMVVKSDVIFPTLKMRVTHTAVPTGHTTPKMGASILRWLTIRGPQGKMEIDGQALADCAAAACALSTTHGVLPNLDSMLKDDGFSGKESTCMFALPAAFKPGSYELEFQLNDLDISTTPPSGGSPVDIVVSNRLFYMKGTQRELPADGAYFYPSAKRIIGWKTDSIHVGDESKAGKFIVVADPAVNGGLVGDNADNKTVAMTFMNKEEGYTLTNLQVKELVADYEARLGTSFPKQVLVTPDDYTSLNYTRDTNFDTTMIKLDIHN